MQRYAWACVSSQVGAWFGILLARDTAIRWVLEMVLMLLLGVNSIRIRAWLMARRARSESGPEVVSVADTTRRSRY
jgi:hypothetical protein